MATLQTSLLFKLPFPFLFPNHSTHKPHRHFSFNPTRLRPRVLPPPLCTFQPDATTPHSDPNPTLPEPKPDSVDVELINSTENDTVAGLDSNSNESRFESVDGERLEASESEKKVSKLPIVVFLIGVWVRARERVERAFSEFFDWWPFWRQEKRLAKLISEADVNRQDAAKQSALFVELNKHRFCEFASSSFVVFYDMNI